MMTKAINEKVNEAVLNFNYSFENGCDGDIFNKRYQLAEKRFNSVFSNIISDLWAVQRLGFIDSNERELIVNEIQTIQRNTRNAHCDKVEERLGEREYYIQWALFRHYEDTRENAEKWVNEMLND